jgi:hypothetical protein
VVRLLWLLCLCAFNVYGEDRTAWEHAFLFKVAQCSSCAVEDPSHLTTLKGIEGDRVPTPQEGELCKIAEFVGSDLVLSINTRNGLWEGLLETKYGTAIITTALASVKTRRNFWFTETQLLYHPEGVRESFCSWPAEVLLLHAQEIGGLKCNGKKMSFEDIIKSFKGSKIVFIGRGAPPFFLAEENCKRFMLSYKSNNISFYQKELKAVLPLERLAQMRLTPQASQSLPPGLSDNFCFDKGEKISPLLASECSLDDRWIRFFQGGSDENLACHPELLNRLRRIFARRVVQRPD